MPRNLITTAVASICLTGLVGIWSFASAEPPLSPVEQQIQQALDGQSSGAEPRDGILADILGVINERGSVLDGSVLDESALDRSPLDAEIETPRSGDPANDTARARAAEQLLKASRLLEKLTVSDADRTELVSRMRAEAVKLLTE